MTLHHALPAVSLAVVALSLSWLAWLAVAPCSWFPRHVGPVWWYAPERCAADGGAR